MEALFLVGAALAAVPESTLHTLEGKEVTLTLSDGREASGTLEDASAGNVVIITATGEVLTAPVRNVSAVRVNTGAPAASTAAPTTASAGRATAPSAPASAGTARNDIGLREVPERPASRSCTWTWSEGRSRSVRMEDPPTALVRWDYAEHAVPRSGRYYDEDGNVYRSSEVVNIVRGSGCCPEQMEDYDRYQTRAMIWAIPASALLVLSAPIGGVLGWPFLVPEIIASKNAQNALNDGVYEYNRQGGS